MLSEHEANERAYVYERMTGRTCELDTVHHRQLCEGYQPCFGRMECWCTYAECIWHTECMKLRRTPRVGEPLWLSLTTPAPHESARITSGRSASPA